MVEGVTDGFEKRLEIQGVGYRAALKGKNLELALGYSHPVSIEAPDGIEFEVPQPTRDHRPRHRQAARRPGRRRTSASAARRSPTRARASATRASRSSARSVSAHDGQSPSRQQRDCAAAAASAPRSRGTAERPRLSVYRSNRGVFAQLIDDDAGPHPRRRQLDRARPAQGLDRIEQAKKAGELLAERGKDAGVETCVFDRGGYQYHGRVKALAEGAREGGLKSSSAVPLRWPLL